MYRTLFLAILLISLIITENRIQPANSEITLDSSTGANMSLAPLLDNLGTHHHPISTESKLAQRYFDQGLILTYGFNHGEAARSFREAARLDPDCAMCYWGIALVLGPNINAMMEPEAVPEAYSALQKAKELAVNGSEREQAYIQALSKRYRAYSVNNRDSLDRAYAEAMGEVAKKYPEDLDAATLYAEALMDTTPWDYWVEGKPKPETKEILTTLESVLAKNPNHPGANHLYIHAVESSPHPEQGEAAADRLRNLVPGAGHLVHMPGHIYINIGRYNDTSVVNQEAIAADQAYISQCHAQGLYPLAYIPHNQHFLWASATMEGRSELAIQAARDVAASVDTEIMAKPGYGMLQHFYAMPLYALTKFERWEEIIEEPEPQLPYLQGVWHFARGMAYVGQGDLSQGEQELAILKEIAVDNALKEVNINFNSAVDLIRMATDFLEAKLASQKGDYDIVIADLKEALVIEDQLHYDEPTPWYSPVRQFLGTVLLKANFPAEAEKFYSQDLDKNPENGWSLKGLAQSLYAQGKSQAAEKMQERFERAWKYADAKLKNFDSLTF